MKKTETTFSKVEHRHGNPEAGFECARDYMLQCNNCLAAKHAKTQIAVTDMRE